MGADLTVGTLLAAGLSRRFGSGNKLLADLDGQPLVAHAANALLNAGCDACIAITSDSETEAALPSQFVVRRIAAGGAMALSFRAAIDLAREMGAARLLICLGDMPGVTADFLRDMLARDGNVACSCGMRRMPPVLLEQASYEAAWHSAKGDAGARRFIAGLPQSAIIPIGEDIAVDVDRQEDLVRLLEARRR